MFYQIAPNMARIWHPIQPRKRPRFAGMAFFKPSQKNKPSGFLRRGFFLFANIELHFAIGVNINGHFTAIGQPPE